MADELEDLYRAMSDDEMRKLGGEYASLTDEAQTLVRSEFKRRSLEVPTVEEEQSPDLTSKVTTIRQYRDPVEASMARSVLEAAGVWCFLRDENTIRIDWLWSNLMGGIRLQVLEQDVEAAQALLSEPIPERIEVEGEADYEQPRCPRCGSLDTGFNNFDAKVGAASILILGFPLPSPVDKDYWHCGACGCNWFDEADATASDAIRPM